MTYRQSWRYAAATLLVGTLALPSAQAVDSGSTGADGVLAPVVDVAIGVPPSGILNYSTINIPENVTVTFFANAANTPVVLLVQGDAAIDGAIDISGKDGGATSGRQGGPGGFAGGIGGRESDGGNGQGPGGGFGGVRLGSFIFDCSGTGGGFAQAGGESVSCPDLRGRSYGSERLVPLIGGSGGGGGKSTVQTRAGGGGGGGGALLLAVSGTLTLNGTIRATGGAGGDTSANTLTAGGGGSGGAVRIVTSSLAGSGSIDVSGGEGGLRVGSVDGGAGSSGRARVEAESVLGSISSVPAGVLRLAGPSDIFPANLPIIRIATVDGVPVGPQPNGVDDVVLPTSIVNPVTVGFTASNIPLGTQIQLTMTPEVGAPLSTLSEALTGTVQSSSASASIDLPQGSSVLTAAASFSITAANGALLERFSHLAGGEAVERVEVVTSVGRGSSTRFITGSGKIYTWPSNAVALR